MSKYWAPLPQLSWAATPPPPPLLCQAAGILPRLLTQNGPRTSLAPEGDKQVGRACGLKKLNTTGRNSAEDRPARKRDNKQKRGGKEKREQPDVER